MISKERLPEQLNRLTESTGSRGGVIGRYVEVLYQSVKGLIVDDGPQWAAAVAYYVLLSAFPLMLVGASIISFFVDPEWAVQRATDLLGTVLPEGDGQVEQTVDEAIAARGQIGLIAFVGLLWSGTRVFKTLARSMNIAFDVDQDYGFLRRLGVEVLMLLTVGMFFVFALLSHYATNVLWDAVRFLPGNDGVVYDWITGGIRAALLLLAFFLLYRFVPHGNHPWKASLTGASVATFLFLIGSPLFRYYLTEFSNHNVIYGSLAMLVVILIWIWIVALITLYGGEVAAHTEAMIYQGVSRDSIEQRHRNRARRPVRNDTKH
jgi:membrane protein